MTTYEKWQVSNVNARVWFEKNHRLDRELLVRNALLNLEILIITRADSTGVELARNKYSLPLHAVTWTGLKRMIERV